MLALLLLAPALAQPLLTPERGLFESPFELVIEAEEGDSELYYVMGDGDPLAYGNIHYDGPVSIEGTTVLRAIEVYADGQVSQVATHSYLFPADTIVQAEMDTRITEDPVYGPLMLDALTVIPTISLVTPDGLDQTEREASIEWLDPEGGSFQIQAGLNQAGGTSLGYDKVSYRLHFRSTYGASQLEYPLFETEDERYASGAWPADGFDALTLRSGSHDTVFWLGTRGQYLRNRWMDETMLAMGHAVPHGRYAQLYIDGSYVGHYHVREHFNGAFAADYRGGDEDDYSTINACSTSNGDPGTWTSAVGSSYDYTEAVRWIDVENFLDYVLMELYGANVWDWAGCHNWKAVGPNVPDAGGLQFQAHDCDITLCYACETNMLSHAGPGDIFGRLRADWHPDFQTLLADRIHRLFEADGALTADNAAERYAWLASWIELSIVAESARWGDGWWERDEDWYAEQDRLFDDFFPCRTDTIMQQFRDEGWYPLDAPEVDLEPGVVEVGAVVTVMPPEGIEAEVWISTVGDPRLPGGEVAADASGPFLEASLTLDHPTLLSARLRDGEQWGALHEAWYEPDRAPPLVLNEWNAVAEDELIEGGDDSLGSVAGNGGDWLELVVIEDGLSLGGWQLELDNRNGEQGTLVFTDHELWSDLTAGTIVTVAEAIEADTSYAPDADDWNILVRAGIDGTAEHVSALDFDVDELDWQLTVRDADGNIRFGPVGEGVVPRHGVSSRETGILQDDPGPSVRRTGDYDDSDISTIGAPNRWDGGEQSFEALRYGPGAVEDLGDSGSDEGDSDTGAGLPPVSGLGGCGCASGGRSAGWWCLLALAIVHRRR